MNLGEDEVAFSRIFVDNVQFNLLQSKGEFYSTELFSGNLYGYPASEMRFLKSHTILDISPNLLEHFLSGFPDALVIGMQSKLTILDHKKRMQKRGDTVKRISERMPFVVRDIKDLKTVKSFIDKRGKYFEIKDNTTIPCEIIPWLENELGLQA